MLETTINPKLNMIPPGCQVQHLHTPWALARHPYKVAEVVVEESPQPSYPHHSIIFQSKSARSSILNPNKRCQKSLRTSLWASQHISSSVSTIHCLMVSHSVPPITPAPDFSASRSTMCQSVGMQGTSHLVSSKLLWPCMPQQVASAWCLLAFFRTKSLS